LEPAIQYLKDDEIIAGVKMGLSEEWGKEKFRELCSIRFIIKKISDFEI